VPLGRHIVGVSPGQCRSKTKEGSEVGVGGHFDNWVSIGLHTGGSSRGDTRRRKYQAAAAQNEKSEGRGWLLLARGDHFFSGTPGGRPGGSGPIWAWERPPPRALDGRGAALPCALRRDRGCV
jgi:hypothetical protein